MAKTKPKVEEFEFEVTVTMVYTKMITVSAATEEEATNIANDVVNKDGEGIAEIMGQAPEDWCLEETRGIDGPL